MHGVMIFLVVQVGGFREWVKGQALPNWKTLFRKFFTYQCIPVCPPQKTLLEKKIFFPENKNISQQIVKHLCRGNNVLQFAHMISLLNSKSLSPFYKLKSSNFSTSSKP